MTTHVTPNSLSTPTPELITLFLTEKRSLATRRIYRSDLTHFFSGMPTEANVKEFLSLAPSDLSIRLTTYKAQLVDSGLADATVNRRLITMRSFISFAHRLGLSTTDGRNLVSLEKVRPYRDTRGIDLPSLRTLVTAPDTTSIRGLRDRAILCLLAHNALRCSEVLNLDVRDFDPQHSRIWILGKGRGTQKEAITLSPTTTTSIAAYLSAVGHKGGPLFRNLDHRPSASNQRLTPNGLRFLVLNYGKQIGVHNLSPHKLRHSSITAALDATQGNVRLVQKLSRHARIETLLRYDDNRRDLQGEVTTLLEGLLA